MKKIPLTQGYFALIDDDDYQLVNQYRWSINKHINTNYAVTNIILPDGSRKTWFRMHRLIMIPNDDQAIDHIDGNGLNNTRDNLRLCVASQNKANTLKQEKYKNKKTTSKYKGVSWHKRDKKWTAQIGFNRKLIHLGYFDNETEAAMTYNKAARLYFGEFARLNEVKI